MGKVETEIQNQIMIECSDIAKIFRYQVGLFYTETGIPVKIGVKGHSDLGGHRISDGKSIYIECKTPIGKARPEQINFIKQMQKTNALAGFARSVEEARKTILGE